MSETRFLLEKDSVCYGCEHYIREEEIMVQIPKEDMNYGGTCVCNEICIEGSMNQYNVKS